MFVIATDLNKRLLCVFAFFSSTLKELGALPFFSFSKKYDWLLRTSNVVDAEVYAKIKLKSKCNNGFVVN